MGAPRTDRLGLAASRCSSAGFVLVVPVAAAFAALPSRSLKVMLMVLVLVGGLFVSLMYADSVRASRLRQHDLPVPIAT